MEEVIKALRSITNNEVILYIERDHNQVLVFNEKRSILFLKDNFKILQNEILKMLISNDEAGIKNLLNCIESTDIIYTKYFFNITYENEEDYLSLEYPLESNEHPYLELAIYVDEKMKGIDPKKLHTDDHGDKYYGLVTPINSYFEQRDELKKEIREILQSLLERKEDYPKTSSRKPIDPIIWTGDNVLLGYLIQWFKDEGLISKKTARDTIIKNHFVDDKGKPIENIKQALSNMKALNNGSLPKNFEKIQPLLKTLKDLL